MHAPVVGVSVGIGITQVAVAASSIQIGGQPSSGGWDARCGSVKGLIPIGRWFDEPAKEILGTVRRDLQTHGRSGGWVDKGALWLW